jgi:hypothetical protein
VLPSKTFWREASLKSRSPWMSLNLISSRGGPSRALFTQQLQAAVVSEAGPPPSAKHTGGVQCEHMLHVQVGRTQAINWVRCTLG